MSNWYLKLTGQFAALVGRLDKYSDEHLSFLSSGYECPQCKKILMNWYGVSNVVALSPEGQRLPVAMVRLKATSFQCPICQHRWKFRSV